MNNRRLPFEARRRLPLDADVDKIATAVGINVLWVGTLVGLVAFAVYNPKYRIHTAVAAGAGGAWVFRPWY